MVAWISVENKLPPASGLSGQDYIVWVVHPKTGDSWPRCATWIYGKFQESDEGFLIEVLDITHWMPFPEGPDAS
jgi:hypothetical protein